jgi:hypothetical protein
VTSTVVVRSVTDVVLRVLVSVTVVVFGGSVTVLVFVSVVGVVVVVSATGSEVAVADVPATVLLTCEATLDATDLAC